MDRSMQQGAERFRNQQRPPVADLAELKVGSQRGICNRASVDSGGSRQDPLPPRSVVEVALLRNRRHIEQWIPRKRESMFW